MHGKYDFDCVAYGPMTNAACVTRQDAGDECCPGCTQGTIARMDYNYIRRTAGISMKQRPGRRLKEVVNVGECMVPGCDRPAKSLHMCNKHYQQHQQARVIRIDARPFDNDEALDLYREVFRLSGLMEMTVDEAATWLLAEGVKRFRTRYATKEQKPHA